MGSLNIIWRKQALKDLNSIAAWYSENMSCQSAQKVIMSAYEAVRLLSVQPGIGIIQQDLSTGRYISIADTDASFLQDNLPVYSENALCVRNQGDKVYIFEMTT